MALNGEDRDRVALSVVVFVVLFAQILLYPGIPSLVEALGASPELGAGAAFIAAEFVAYILFAALWGAASDSSGKRVPFVVAAAAVASVAYFAVALTPRAGIPFEGALALRFVQGAATVGTFSLAVTTLMDLGGGHGRNMGAAGVSIGGGVALGAPVGGFLYEVGALVPLYVAGVLLGVAAVVCLTVDDRAPTGERGVRRALRRLAETPALSVPYAFGFVDRLTAGFFALVGTFYFQEVFGLGAAETGVTLASFLLRSRSSSTLSDVSPTASDAFRLSSRVRSCTASRSSVSVLPQPSPGHAPRCSPSAYSAHSLPPPRWLL